MNDFCCNTFEKLIIRFNWMKLAETGEYIMPYLQVGDIKYRINNCPSCGKEVRNIQIKEERFNQIIKTQ